jgi:hypothetical protein
VGQDGEDRKGDDADVSIQPGGRHRRTLDPFDKEIGVAVRYERGLVFKALAVLVVLAVIVVLRTLYFE